MFYAVLNLSSMSVVGRGINNRKSSIIGNQISTVTASFAAILGAHVEEKYLRGCRTFGVDPLFRTQDIASNTLFPK